MGAGTGKTTPALLETWSFEFTQGLIWVKVGALIIRIGFWWFLIIFIVENPILIIKAPVFIHLRKEARAAKSGTSQPAHCDLKMLLSMGMAGLGSC